MKKILILAATLLIALFTFANEDFSVSTFMSDDEISRVLNDEIITRMYIKYNHYKDATDLELTIPSTKYAEIDSTKYQMITDDKSFLPYELTDEAKKLEFYNTISDPAKLKGMTYYSRKADKVKPLVLDAYQTTENGWKIDSVQQAQIIPHLSGHFKQRDNKFGTMKFKSDLYNIDNDFVLINDCQNSIPFVCKPGEYRTITYFIYDEANKGFYIYSTFLLVIRSDFLLDGTGILTLNPTTFSNRLRAATVHMARILGVDWDEKHNPWDKEKIKNGEYRNY